MAERYLTPADLRQWLENGRAVEQWLDTRIDGSDRLIKWLRIHKDRRGGYEVTRFEVYDQGNESFIDIYEFSSYEPDEPFGSSQKFEDWEQALEYAVTEGGANPNRFVSDGVIQNEYADFIKLSGVWPSNRS
jgi:hypothetical protein